MGANALSVAVQAEDGTLKNYGVTVTRAASLAGFVDTDFDPNVTGNYVMATAVQPDGKVVIGGGFSSVGGQARNRVSRLSADGAVESNATFNPGTGADSDVYGGLVQPDGKIVLGGAFTSVNGQLRNRLARLNADGTLESAATFNAGIGANNFVNCIALQPDGKILLAGEFSSVNGAVRRGVARLLPNGAVESTATFNAGTGANGAVTCLAVQADGRILLAGQFTSVNGVPRSRLARLQTDGTLESTNTFHPSAVVDGDITALAVQADGKILLGGDFMNLDGEPRAHLARLLPDGSLESAGTFAVGAGADGVVYSFALQGDGKILLGGNFANVNGQPRHGIARLNADGTVESTATFNAGSGVDSAVSPVLSMALQADGGILVGGFFDTLDGRSRHLFARLTNDAATDTLSIVGSTGVVWTRGGAGPEAGSVAFERTGNGGASWSALGAGVRVAGGWELAGLNLSGNGQIRARGSTVGGYQNSSSGLVQTVASYTFDADRDGLLDAWELRFFPSTAGHSAGDDFDGDGVLELAEEAFGLDPTRADAAGVPQPVNEGGYLTITFSKHAGVTSEVQSAGTLLDGQANSFSAATTTVLTDTAATLKVRDNFFVGSTAARYLRVVLTAAP